MHPEHLNKKVTLLQHFKSYLETKNDGSSSNNASSPSNDKIVYVKKWMRTKHAIMFRLSNKVVQVDFQDKTEVLLNSESRWVTYLNKKGEKVRMPLS